MPTPGHVYDLHLGPVEHVNAPVVVLTLTVIIKACAQDDHFCGLWGLQTVKSVSQLR